MSVLTFQQLLNWPVPCQGQPPSAIVGSDAHRFDQFAKLVSALMNIMHEDYLTVMKAETILPTAHIAYLEKRWSSMRPVQPDALASLYFRLETSGAHPTAVFRWQTLIGCVEDFMVALLFNATHMATEMDAKQMESYAQYADVTHNIIEAVSNDVSDALGAVRDNRFVEPEYRMTDEVYEKTYNLQVRQLVELVHRAGLVGDYAPNPFEMFGTAVMESDFALYPSLIHFVKAFTGPEALSRADTYSSLFAFLQSFSANVRAAATPELPEDDYVGVFSELAVEDAKILHRVSDEKTIPRSDECTFIYEDGHLNIRHSTPCNGYDCTSGDQNKTTGDVTQTSAATSADHGSL